MLRRRFDNVNNLVPQCISNIFQEEIAHAVDEDQRGAFQLERLAELVWTDGQVEAVWKGR